MGRYAVKMRRRIAGMAISMNGKVFKEARKNSIIIVSMTQAFLRLPVSGAAVKVARVAVVGAVVTDASHLSRHVNRTQRSSNMHYS
jgi:hypothetical protein